MAPMPAPAAVAVATLATSAPLPPGPVILPSESGRCLAAAISTIWHGIHVNGIAIGKNQSIQAQPQFTFALHMARPLCVTYFSSKIRADRNDHFVVDGDRKRSAEVHRVAWFGGGGGDSIFEVDTEARARRHDNVRAGFLLNWSRCGGLYRGGGASVWGPSGTCAAAQAAKSRILRWRP